MPRSQSSTSRQPPNSSPGTVPLPWRIRQPSSASAIVGEPDVRGVAPVRVALDVPPELRVGVCRSRVEQHRPDVVAIGAGQRRHLRQSRHDRGPMERHDAEPPDRRQQRRRVRVAHDDLGVRGDHGLASRCGRSLIESSPPMDATIALTDGSAKAALRSSARASRIVAQSSGRCPSRRVFADLEAPVAQPRQPALEDVRERVRAAPRRRQDRDSVARRKTTRPDRQRSRHRSVDTRSIRA